MVAVPLSDKCILFALMYLICGIEIVSLRKITRVSMRAFNISMCLLVLIVQNCIFINTVMFYSLLLNLIFKK